MTFEFAKSQIKRMGGLDDFPAFAPEAEDELALVAAKRANSETHLRATVDEILAGWTKCPKPSELRAMLDRNRVEHVIASCSDCNGSGWRIVSNGHSTGAERCPCGSVPAPPGVTPALGKPEKRKPSTGLNPVDPAEWLQ